MDWNKHFEKENERIEAEKWLDEALLYGEENEKQEEIERKVLQEAVHKDSEEI